MYVTSPFDAQGIRYYQQAIFLGTNVKENDLRSKQGGKTYTHANAGSSDNRGESKR